MILTAGGGGPVLTLAELEVFDTGTSPGRKERRFLCPLPACADKPRDASHRSLSLNTDTGDWHCHRCTAGGRLREHWNPPLPRAQARRAALRRAFGLTDDPPPAPPEPVQVQALPLHGTDGERYLAVRGISTDLAVTAGARFAPSWYGRPAVVFPVRDQAGVAVAAHGRYIDDRLPKSRTMGSLSSGVFVATTDALLADPLVITEAPIDALSLAACGVGAIALCGTSWPAWLPRAAAFRQVYTGLDADDAGDNAAEKIAAAFTFGSKVERLRPRGGKDWNEILQSYGADRLRRHLFDRYAVRRYAAVWKRLQCIYDGQAPPPHPALEQAIDTADWPAFSRELRAYEARSLPSDAPADEPAPVEQMELFA